MRYRIFSYSSAFAIALSSSLFLLFAVVFEATGQNNRPVHVPKRDQKRAKQEEVKVDTIPLFYGAYVGVDLFGVGSKLFGGDFLSSEVSLTANLKNKFLPTLELGYGSTDAWNETGIHYKSSAPFFRIGVDYNTMSRKKNKNNYLYVGLRYGLSNFAYSINNLPATDPIWGDGVSNPSFGDGIWGGESVPFNQDRIKATMQWMEIVAGVKVHIYKNFNMGWAFRLRYKLSATANEQANPWYVPGYGKYKSNNIGVTYSLIYKLPIQKKNKKR